MKLTYSRQVFKHSTFQESTESFCSSLTHCWPSSLNSMPSTNNLSRTRTARFPWLRKLTIVGIRFFLRSWTTLSDWLLCNLLEIIFILAFDKFCYYRSDFTEGSLNDLMSYIDFKTFFRFLYFKNNFAEVIHLCDTILLLCNSICFHYISSSCVVVLV